MTYFELLFNNGYSVKTNLYKVRAAIKHQMYSLLDDSTITVGSSSRLSRYIEKLGIFVGNITDSQLSHLCHEHNFSCYWCSKSIKDEVIYDHYVPLALGGPHAIYNLVPSCTQCNRSKYSKDPLDFAATKKKNLLNESKKRSDILKQANIDEGKYQVHVSSMKTRKKELIVKVAYEERLHVYVFLFSRFDKNASLVFRELPQGEAYFIKARFTEGIPALWAIPGSYFVGGKEYKYYSYVCNRLRDEGALLQFLKIDYLSIPHVSIPSEDKVIKFDNNR